MKSFLLMGQSNMAGRGDFGEVPPIRNSRCFMLRNGLWQPMNEPICFDRGIEPVGKYGFHSGTCLAASFADCASRYFKEDIGLIPCAEGDTSLSQWQPGEILFDHAVAITRLAMRTSDLAGILWHQGESDSVSLNLVHAYHDQFMNMYSALVQVLHAENLPFLVGGLGDFTGGYHNGECVYFQEINNILSKLPKKTNNIAFVPANGLTCRRDSIHFDSKSLREFGIRFFDTYLTFLENKGNSECQPIIV